MRVLDTSNLDNAINLEKLKLQAALTSNVNFTGEDVPARNIFREFVSIPFSASETLGFSFTKPENVYLGFIAGNVNIDTQRVNFRPLDGSRLLDFAANDVLRISESVLFTGFDVTRQFYLSYGELAINEGVEIGVNFSDRAGQTFFFVEQNGTTILENNSIFVNNGALVLSMTGRFLMSGGRLQAGPGENHHIAVQTGQRRLTDSAANTDVASTAGIQLDNVFLTTEAAEILLFSRTVEVTDSRFRAERLNIQRSPQGLFSDLPVINTIAFRGNNLSNLALINMEARTIVLQEINFAAGSSVNLRSEVGLLAPEPNTRRPTLRGHVNFIHEVTYAGEPAQDHVSVSVGGNSTGPSAINISSL